MTGRDWLRLAERPGFPNLDTPEGIRLQLSWVRDQAKSKFAGRLQSAVNSYANANAGQLPTDISQLKPYLDSQTTPPDPDELRRRLGNPNTINPFNPSERTLYAPISEELLQRYQVIQAGNVADLRPSQ